MSDRDVAAPDEKWQEWMRSVDDRLNQLQSRRLQGALSAESMTIGAATIGASRTDPLRLNGSVGWTQSVEYLGQNPPSADNGNHALVTRDELGRIQDILPRPVIFVTSGPGAGLSVPPATVVYITAVGSGVAGGPYAESDMYLGGGVFRVPVSGFWTMQHIGIWPGINDTTTRQIALDISTNGGASYATIATDMRMSSAPGDNVYHDFTETLSMNAGTLLKFWVRQRSVANPWPYFNDNMAMIWQRGPL